MKKFRMFEEWLMKSLMIAAFSLVVGCLGLILFTVIKKGLPSLSIEMLTQIPKGGFYLGKEGGILNAMVGSLYLAGGGTLIALLFAYPMALFINTYLEKSFWAVIVRLAMDVLWGIPSIIYGAFGFTLMIVLGVRASLLAGMLTLAMLEFPIITRAMDEVIRLIPRDLSQASLALGATNLETSIKVITRQSIPGMITAVLLAFGRGIGDAASVLFTAGYTDRIPDNLMRPAASLPLAVFFQLGTPIPEVQQRAFASALILSIIVLVISLGSRWLSRSMSRYIIH